MVKANRGSEKSALGTDSAFRKSKALCLLMSAYDQTILTHSILTQSIENYQALVTRYTLAREQMIARRRGAADHVMVELDERLETNKRMIDALSRALELSREHLKLLDRLECDPLLGVAVDRFLERLERDPLLGVAVDRLLLEFPGTSIDAMMRAAEECRLQLPRAPKMEQLLECIRGKLKPPKL